MFSSLKVLHKNYDLILIFLIRDISSRFKGSYLGIFWMIATPLFMLAIFTFIFGEIFKIKWLDIPESKNYFAIILFSGLMIYNFFAESLSKSSTLFVSNVNYIKKILFPLEILPVISVLSCAVQLAVTFLVWLIFYFIVVGIPDLSILLFPIILLPFFFILTGLTFLFSTLGVFFRDTSSIINVLITMLLFLSPIFYPISIIPEEYQIYIYINPVAYQIEITRDILLWNTLPNLNYFGMYLVLSFLFFSLTISYFRKYKDRFIDVI